MRGGRTRGVKGRAEGRFAWLWQWLSDAHHAPDCERGCSPSPRAGSGALVLELELVHRLLVEAGVRREDVHEVFPFVPASLAERFHPWEPQCMAEATDLVHEFVGALNASIPVGHLMEALSAGVDPDAAGRLWHLGRSTEDFRNVSAYAHAVATLSLKPGDHADHIDTVSDTASKATWTWLESPIPVARIVIYIRAGVDVAQAMREHEPTLSASDGFAAIEMLAALNTDAQLEELVQWSLY